MSAAYSLYIPIPWEHSIDGVLKNAGFQVTLRVGKPKDGKIWREYLCTRHQASFSFSVAPSEEGDLYLFVLGVSRPRHGAVLFAAGNKLIEHGALDGARYRERNGGQS